MSAIKPSFRKMLLRVGVFALALGSVAPVQAAPDQAPAAQAARKAWVRAVKQLREMLEPAE